MCSMKTIELKSNNQNFVFKCKKGNSNAKRISIVLPNGYGFLKYVEGLVKFLQKDFQKVYVPLVRGQVEDGKFYNISDATYDLQAVFKHIFNDNADVQYSIFAHCSSMLYLLELADSNPKIFKKFNRIILYSFLAQPIKHFNRFTEKANKLGITVNQDKEYLLRYNDISLYENIPCKLHVVHPKTKLNSLRANKNELATLLKLNNVVTIDTPSKGYEIEDSFQTADIRYIYENYFKSIINSN